MRTIIAATDLSTRSDIAVRRAKMLAAEAGARLLLVHVIDDDQPAALVESRVREADAWLRSGADARGALQPGQIRVLTGDIFRTIHTAAEEAGADLIVAGDHRRGIVRDLFSETTVERLVRHASVPVLVARRAADGPYGRALLAVESEEAQELIRSVFALGQKSPPGIVLVNVVDAAAAGMMAYAGVDMAKIRAYRRDVAEQALERLRSTLDEELRNSVTMRTVEGYPEIVLNAEAEGDDCGLLVVSTHARRGFSRALLGSVSAGLIRRGTTDLLIVPRHASQNT